MTKTIIRGALLAGTSFAALAVTGVPAALAQESAADAGTIEEIVVVSRRREETVQDVPATVSVLTASTLESAGVERAEDFLRMTPGVSIVDTAEVGDTQVNIRGINGARDAENSFAFIVDGVLMTNPAAFNREFADLQQIEVMKGPQGAIYGRNAAAGAIVVTTKKPGNEFTSSARASYANKDSIYGSASLSGPLMQDELFFGLHFDYRDTDGFYKNSFKNGEPTARFENYNFSGRLVWEPSDATSLDIKARYGESDGSAITFNAEFALENFANALGNPAAFLDVNDHDFIFQNNVTSDNDQTAFEISAKLEQDVGAATLTAWMLYSDIDNNFIADGTSGAFGFFASDPVCQQSAAALAGYPLPAPTFNSGNPVPVLVDITGSFFGPYTPTTCDGIQEQLRNQTDFSMEVRLAGEALDARARWEVGGYYLDINRQVGVSLNRDAGGDPVRGLFQRAADSEYFTEALLWDDFDSTVFAFFGNVSYDVTSDIEITAAIRYDNEDRKVHNLVPTDVITQFIDLDGDFIPGGSPLNPALLLFPGGIPDQNKTFSEFEPKISASWDASDDITLFASWGRGFKSGGFNNVGSAATIDGSINFLNSLFDPGYIPVSISDQFRKETSSAFEAGIKGNAMQGRLHYEGAFYYTDVNDMQSFEFFVGPFGLLRVVNNIDNVDIKGFEFSAAADLHEYFTVGAGFNILDSEIKAFASRPDTIGNKSPYTADYTINAFAEFNYPVVNDVELTARADLLVMGPTWFHSVQNQERMTINGAFIALPGFFCDQLEALSGVLGFQVHPVECEAPDNGASMGRGNYALTRRDSYTTLDIRLGLQAEAWSLIAFGKNVTKEKYLAEVIPAPEFGGSFIHPADLRTWGVELSFRY